MAIQSIYTRYSNGNHTDDLLCPDPYTIAHTSSFPEQDIRFHIHHYSLNRKTDSSFSMIFWMGKHGKKNI
ncbi:hypothetical protein AZH53_06590 [Methanomicrobiaceae archaeon CYW5]|nr:hypothetical protein [Methanovulcanius yangii]